MRHLLHACAGLLVVAGALPAQCPPTWWPGEGFDMRGGSASDAVYALAEMPNGDIVAGGLFSVAGGIGVNNIARWDGQVWTALGNGIQGGAVRALAVLPNGDLVAGGAFTTAGGVAVDKIARWDGTSWSGLGTGIAGSAVPVVRALAKLPNGNLVAAGSFTSAGGVSAKNVALWSGSAWASLGSGVFNPGVNAPELTVTALAVHPGGAVFAGTASSPGAPSFVSRWNGTSWLSIGSVSSLSSSNPNSVAALAVLPNGDLIVGGQFLLVPGPFIGTPAANIARWNGSNWFAMGQGLSAPSNSAVPVQSLAVLANGDLAATGNFIGSGASTAFGLMRWNGATWTSMSGTSGSSLLALSSGPMVLGGSFSETSLVGSSRIARWGCDAGVARQRPFGAGCYWETPTCYEDFASAQSFDLSSSTLQFVLTPTGYAVNHIPGTPAFVQPTSAPLSLRDDGVVSAPLPFTIPYPGGTTSSIDVLSNGCVCMQPTQLSAAYGGLSAPLFNGAPRHAAMWGDQDPTSPGTGSGTIHVDVVGQTALVTWLAVQEFGRPGLASTFQIALSANGTVEYRYLDCNHLVPVLTGWSPGNGAVDPSSHDLSAHAPFQTSNASYLLSPRHSTDRRPLLGSTMTLTTSELPVATVLGNNWVGFTRYEPGIELSNLGMPDCRIFASLDIMFVFIPVGQSGSSAVAIPNDPFLAGLEVYSQGMAWDLTANAAGMIGSNGLALTLGRP